MITRFLNLLLAQGMVVCAVFIAQRGYENWSASTVFHVILAPAWFAGAFWLCFNRRWAWGISLLGSLTVLCGSLATLGRGSIMAPVTIDPSEGAGYAMIIGALGLALSLLLLIGLLLMRKETR